MCVQVATGSCCAKRDYLDQDQAMTVIRNMRSPIKALVLALILANTAGAAQANTVVNLGTQSALSSRTFSDTFSAPAIPGLLFRDDYIFTLTAESAFGAIANTVDLAGFQINNLTMLLYSGTGPLAAGTAPLLQANSTGFSNGGTTGEVVVANPILLGAGSYTLELMGMIKGATGGSYSGSFNISPMTVSPVPEPNSALAILAGLVLLGIGMRRKLQFRSKSAEFV